ncbi:MmgE/PrpD family protein 1 [Bordetella trematum]|uniref:Catabolic enzyme n=1 Tax=Bordetella trematum TaxID=123899 RepID=A0A157SMD6_9BORD|nr:MmgE/PrpD family protein [Bordetella trematum]AZR93719.1 MmgE/PrpD family protein 1 [Bordetella trematum]NNH17434.1 MmgE/PrpD family protein [Bordetella trematum]SAI59907.1 catabolic enzyme [Bordetella trematum]SAI71649.1 catabolic enzyme [Bordetella trematum]SUV98163.1 catabolic enzyme [Bordetella trematum]
MSAIDTLINHLLQLRYEDLPPAATDAAKTFILDAIGVGLSGSRHPRMPALRQAARALGNGTEATVWASGERLPLASAAMLNAYQVFNQEFDAIHDRAVVHAFACIVPAAIGYAEREGGINGRQLITAITAGLDFAIYVALAQRAPMRFFRPAMCGGLGATATLCKLADQDEETTRNALGLAYSHLSGTMQAHIEGSPAVGLQVGLNARAAVTAFELARAGFPGPRDILEGPYGYFALYDAGQADWADVQAGVGRNFQITRMSHKPYPTGRATHSGIAAMLQLKNEHALQADDIEHVIVYASSLIVRLVGRDAHPGMDSATARLCMSYTMATALLRGRVGISDFDPEALTHAPTFKLAARIRVLDDGNPDPNAMSPQRIELRLKDGRQFTLFMPVYPGSPELPLSLDEQNAKFHACCSSAQPPLTKDQAHALARCLRNLDTLHDVREISQRLSVAP